VNREPSQGVAEEAVAHRIRPDLGAAATELELDDGVPIGGSASVPFGFPSLSVTLSLGVAAADRRPVQSERSAEGQRRSVVRT
jgi:hypothetical protein